MMHCHRVVVASMIGINFLFTESKRTTFFAKAFHTKTRFPHCNCAFFLVPLTPSYHRPDKRCFPSTYLFPSDIPICTNNNRSEIMVGND